MGQQELSLVQNIVGSPGAAFCMCCMHARTHLSVGMSNRDRGNICTNTTLPNVLIAYRRTQRCSAAEFRPILIPPASETRFDKLRLGYK